LCVCVDLCSNNVCLAKPTTQRQCALPAHRTAFTIADRQALDVPLDDVPLHVENSGDMVYSPEISTLDNGVRVAVILSVFDFLKKLFFVIIQLKRYYKSIYNNIIIIYNCFDVWSYQ
jgi:hypothetical protein